MSEELKLDRCKHCGSNEPRCLKERGGAQTGPHHTKLDAIAAWNRRPKQRTNFDAWKVGLTVDDYMKYNYPQTGKTCPVYDVCGTSSGSMSGCDEAIKQWANQEVKDD